MNNLTTPDPAVVNPNTVAKLFSSLLITALITTVLIGCGTLRSIGVLPSIPAPAVSEPVVPLSQQPMSVDLAISTADDINPDVNFRPSPVKVRIFLSESGTNLESHGINEIFELDGSEMSPSPRATTVLRPGTDTLITLSGVKTESRLTIAVANREPYKTRWMATQQLDVSKPIRIGARITRINVIFNVDNPVRHAQ